MSESMPLRRISRRSTTGIFWGIGASGLVCIAVGILAILGWLFGPINGFIAIGVASAALALGLVKINSRPLAGWLWIRAGYGYRALTRNTIYLFRVDRPRPVANLGLPGDAARLRLVEDPISGAGYVHDPHTSRLTAILRVHHRGALLADPDEQERRDVGFSSLLTSTTRLPHIAAIDVMERTVPGGTDILEHLKAHGTDDLGADSPIRRAYSELADVTQEGLRHESYLSITLDLKGGAETIREMGGGLVGAAALMRETMQTFSTQIGKAGLSDRGWLNEASLSLMLRSVYDPASLPRLERKTVGRTLASAGPMGVTEHFGFVQTDSAFHRVFYVAEWPRSLVGPMAIWALILRTGIQRTFKIVLRPVAAGTSRRQARAEVATIREQRRRKIARKGVDDPEDQAEEQDAQRKQAEIAQGGREFTYAGLISISAETYDELRKASRTLLNAAADADLELKILSGQQAQHLVTAALPFGRGLG